MIYALVLKGKRNDNAYSVQFKTFDCIGDFLVFKEKNEDMESKYWTHVEQVTNDNTVETYRVYLKE